LNSYCVCILTYYLTSTFAIYIRVCLSFHPHMIYCIPSRSLSGFYGFDGFSYRSNLRDSNLRDFENFFEASDISRVTSHFQLEGGLGLGLNPILHSGGALGLGLELGILSFFEGPNADNTLNPENCLVGSALRALQRALLATHDKMKMMDGEMDAAAEGVCGERARGSHHRSRPSTAPQHPHRCVRIEREREREAYRG
jgi:hypothetical protein